MVKLIATRPILLANHLYQPGETLPVWDKAAAAAWLEAGSAILEEPAPVENQPGQSLPLPEKIKSENSEDPLATSNQIKPASRRNGTKR